jgi:hypothetical protein
VPVREISSEEGSRLLRIVPPALRVGGELAAGADRGCCPPRACRCRIAEVTCTSSGPGPRRDPQLRRRRVRRALPALPGRPPGDLQRRPTRRDHQGRPGSAHRPRAAGFDAGAGRSWPSTWSPRGWSPRGWSTIISHQGLRLLLGQEGGSVQRVQSAEDLDRPERRDQEEPGARAVCDRRRPSGGPVPVTPRSSSAWTSSGR